MLEIITEIFVRDLNRLKEEISAYKDASLLWKTTEGISNSGGNLCLHLTGNLKHFIGAILGNTGYVRQRDKEFADKNIPVKDLLKEIDETIAVIQKVIPSMQEEDVNKKFPVHVFKEGMTTGFFLAHLTTHFNYHLGQINYHRRMIA